MRRLSIDQYEALSNFIAILDEREIEPEPSAWLLDHHRDDMDGDYCPQCAREEAQKRGLDSVQAGYWPEVDHSLYCEKCGKPLRYTLTDYGFGEELRHFEEVGFDWSDARQCYELARVAHAAPTDEGKRRVLRVLRKGLNDDR